MTISWKEDIDDEESEELDWQTYWEQLLQGGRSDDLGVPDVGVSANDESLGDGEYLERMTKPRRKNMKYNPEQYYYGKPAPPVPPLDKIRTALEYGFKQVDDAQEPGTTEYMRARLENRVNCPLCDYYDSWNKEDLKEHIAQHREVRRYESFWSNALQEYGAMLERRADLNERIAALKKSIVRGSNSIGKDSGLIKKAAEAAVKAVVEAVFNASPYSSSLPSRKEKLLSQQADLAFILCSCPDCLALLQTNEEGDELKQHIMEEHYDEENQLVKKTLLREGNNRGIWRQLRERRQKIELEIRRLEMEIQKVQTRIGRFESGIDTRALARKETRIEKKKHLSQLRQLLHN